MQASEESAGNLLPVSACDVGSWADPAPWCVGRDVAESARGAAEKCAQSLDHRQIQRLFPAAAKTGTWGHRGQTHR